VARNDIAQPVDTLPGERENPHRCRRRVFDSPPGVGRRFLRASSDSPDKHESDGFTAAIRQISPFIPGKKFLRTHDSNRAVFAESQKSILLQWLTVWISCQDHYLTLNNYFYRTSLVPKKARGLPSPGLYQTPVRLRTLDPTPPGRPMPSAARRSSSRLDFSSTESLVGQHVVATFPISKPRTNSRDSKSKRSLLASPNLHRAISSTPARPISPTALTSHLGRST